MRAGVVMFVVLAATPAAADKKIQDMIPGYQREHGGCQTQATGMQKVATGVALLAKSAPEADRPELDKAAAALARGSAAFSDYCTELGGLVAYLEEQAGATYKSVEREIDNRATKVSRLRRDAKKQAEELGPLTRKMIPRIMQLPKGAPEPEKTTTVKFPSGRTVELPALGGTYRTSGTAISDVIEYEDKSAKLVITTRRLAGACVDHKTAIPKDTTTTILEATNVEWGVRYVRKEDSGSHDIVMMCAQRETSVLGTADMSPSTAPLGDATSKILIKLLAAR